MVRVQIHQSFILAFLSVQLVRSISAGSIPTSGDVLDTLNRRANSCPSQAPNSCTTVDPKLPSNFCCQTGSSCISLDSSSSALCCPDGQSCSSIEPIDCNINLQNATKGLLEPVFTTKLTSTLPSCGSSTCCPFGYTCGQSSNGAAICQIVASKAITPSSSSSSSSTSTATSSTSSTSHAPSTSSSVSPASASSIDSSNPQPTPPSQSGNPFPPGVFLAGFFPGMLVGALGVLAWVILTGRHKKSDDDASTTTYSYSKKPYISGPVELESRNHQSKFLRRSKLLFSKRHEDEGTPGLPFDNWKMPTPPEPNNVPEQPVGRQIPAGPEARYVTDDSSFSTNKYPVTPERQIYGEHAGAGSEIVRIYSPSNIEVPSATVAPLRNMKSQTRSRNPSDGGPFADARMPQNIVQTPARSYEAGYETLSPTRYDGGQVQKRVRPENSVPQSRPETSFTAMLQAINFPDPMSRPTPGMPDVPGQYRR